MKTIIKFWQRDLINKIIVLLFLVLVLGVFGLSVLIIKMPSGRSVQGVWAEFFPTPTLSARAVMTRAAQSAMTQSAILTASVPPTITTMPITPFKLTVTSTQEPPTQQSGFQPLATLAEPTRTQAPPTTTPLIPTPTSLIPTPTRAVAVPSSSATPNVTAGGPNGVACIPPNPKQKGKVLDVLDGNTVKVLIDGLAYIVRYIGVEPSANSSYAMLAATTNGGLVFAKEITLVSDKDETDAAGRLLRYVLVGDTFVNLELVQKGQLRVIDSTPNNSCANTLAGAEQSARSAGLGIWEPTPTPR
ncbi:MAG TPA: thermonuclease family protein [Anaerolineales bacterium]